MAQERIGKYVVVRKLGEGGMGSVFLARHAQIRRQVAIKVLLPQHTRNEDVMRRFFNEAHATAELRHPGLVEVFDFGELDDGSAYLVMEYLEGETLAARIARGPVGPALAAEIGRQVAAAVGAAHARGIIHRDLKPENIVLVADPDLPHKIRVKVLDFGIAKLTGGASTSRTARWLLLGTPAYMSPEQCRGAAAVDHRTDIYALGCIMFEMACGRLPFAFDNFGDLLAAHMCDEPPDPLALAPSMPLALRDCILRCLSKDAGRRFHSAHELARALGEVAVRRGAKRRARSRFGSDEETRFDPQLAARIADDWTHEVSIATCASWQASSSETGAPAASTERGDVWKTRLAVLAMIVGAVGLAAVLFSSSTPPAPANPIAAASAPR